jgi:hypothetical protein
VLTVISPQIKHRIREAAEAEQRVFYRERDLPEWHGALARSG